MVPNKDFKSDEIFYFNTHRSLDLIKSLENRYDVFPVDTIKDIFLTNLGLQIKSVQPSTNFGTGHLIYFVDTDRGVFVFRANYSVKMPEHYMSLESEFIKLYQQADIPVGQVLFADCSRSKYDFDFQILKVLPGKDLKTEWVGEEQGYEKLCIEIGKLVARQYQCPVLGFGRFMAQLPLKGSYKTAYEYLIAYLDFDLQVLKDYKIIDEAYIERILQIFSDSQAIFSADTQAFLVHHDLADHNLRYEGDKIMAVFDWENAVAFDPICELGSAHTWISHFPFKREKMLEGFLAELGYMPANLYRKISIYFLRTMIWKMCFAVRRDKLTIRHQQLFKQALKENGLDFDLIS